MTRTLKTEFRRRMQEENLARIVQCLGELEQEEIWFRPNENCNSVGNLVLHLSGNIRQWIISGLGDEEDQRNRPIEFIPQNVLNTSELVLRITQTVEQACNVVDGLAESAWSERKSIQGFDENGLSVLVHVIEHMSYHVGQITLLTKWMKDKDLKYYEI